MIIYNALWRGFYWLGDELGLETTAKITKEEEY
jgi:hypothetical protein